MYYALPQVFSAFWAFCNLAFSAKNGYNAIFNRSSLEMLCYFFVTATLIKIRNHIFSRGVQTTKKVLFTLNGKQISNIFTEILGRPRNIPVSE